MPKTSDMIPDSLKPYMDHGVDLTWKEGDKEAVGDCPFCGKEGKFSVNIATSRARCWACREGSEKGGMEPYTFIRCVHKHSLAVPVNGEYEKLAEDRGMLGDKWLRRWGVVPSFKSRRWLIPGYDVTGKLNQLYRYTRMTGGKMRLIPTSTLGHQLHLSKDFHADKETIYVCEGPWDAIAFEEMAYLLKEVDGEYKLTANPSMNLLSKANVVAIPGCGAPMEKWTSLFEKKHVVILFDSDYWRKSATGTPIEPAGFQATKRLAGILSGSATPPASISYLHWGDQGYDPELKDGYDIRDALSGYKTISERRAAFSELMAKIRPAPDEWLMEPSKAKPKKTLSLEECESYRELSMVWRKAMKWSTGLDHALVTMLACCASTAQIGDQLWFKVIGPPACGKSTLCEALSTCEEYTHAKSTIRGFHSGTDDGSGEDYSPLKAMANKTLITKDGDTLLQAPNRGQILSEARDIYDTVSRSSYRTKKGGTDWTGLRMTWLLCGTSSLRELDDSELGARFLDCVIMEGIDDEMEDEILIRQARKSRKNILITSDGSKPESFQEPTMTEAMKKTGGYVKYLRENVAELLQEVENNFSEEDELRITRFGKFVAYFRARPSKRQHETVEREMATRLVGTLTRLALCTAVVLNKKRIDDDVMKRVLRIALDTARGVTLKIGKALYESQRDSGMGLEVVELTHVCGKNDQETRQLLRFMRTIGIVKSYLQKPEEGSKRKSNIPKWRLEDKIVQLYEDVHAEAKTDSITF